ncbi:E3 ubiquitin-protein ligase RNF4-like isoform X2 [Drosophila obscura]|uniref:E3 ubiquitin-protein ligase RNF4-like isoform X2 n=1 Tax=Drosophila obscura TaxID=7282 RepID=UPI001BB12F4C|nr:E3 ubiquitin-protein ligase RNF4-like isoform X2 [Drosophila obscura]
MADANLKYNIDMMNVSSEDESSALNLSPMSSPPLRSLTARSRFSSSLSFNCITTLGLSSFLTRRLGAPGNSHPLVDISQVEADIERINRYCSEVVSNISPDTRGSRNSTARMGLHNCRCAPVEVIDLSNVHDSHPRFAANRVPEAVIDLCTPNRPSIPIETIDLDASDIVPTNRRRNHASSSTPTTAGATSAVDDSGPSSPKRKPDAQNVSTDDVYKCPVCLESVRQREPYSTKCGHVFCRECIQTAIRTTRKCPMCNKKLNLRQTSRIYL